MFKSNANFRKAFTLMEILTVTAIFGIMVMAVTPAVMSTAERGRASDCSVNLRKIQSAKAAFLLSNIGKTQVEASDPNTAAEYAACFSDGIIPLVCPSNQGAGGGGYDLVYDLYSDTVCPNNCPKGDDINNYPLEIKAGPPGEWYRNGYHDVYKKN